MSTTTQNLDQVVYFFGVESANRKGHFLFNDRMRGVWENPFPFRYEQLDGGDWLYPKEDREKQPQGKLYLVQRDGWTILGMWDRTADRRFASNASFIAKGVRSEEEMCLLAERHFPVVWKRIREGME